MGTGAGSGLGGLIAIPTETSISYLMARLSLISSAVQMDGVSRLRVWRDKREIKTEEREKNVVG